MFPVSSKVYPENQKPVHITGRFQHRELILWKMEDLRCHIGSVRQHHRGHCPPKTREESGNGTRARAWGHQGKAEARRRAQALSEMLPDAGREKEKSQAAPFFLPAHLLSAPSID